MLIVSSHRAHFPTAKIDHYSMPFPTPSGTNTAWLLSNTESWDWAKVLFHPQHHSLTSCLWCLSPQLKNSPISTRYNNRKQLVPCARFHHKKKAPYSTHWKTTDARLWRVVTFVKPSWVEENDWKFLKGETMEEVNPLSNGAARRSLSATVLWQLEKFEGLMTWGFW